MFRRKVQPLDDLLNQFLRQEGLESPLITETPYCSVGYGSWANCGTLYPREVYQKPNLIRKDYQPALRANLSMMQSDLTKKLNAT